MNNVNLNKDVMGLLKTKGRPTQLPQIEKAKEQLRQIFIQNNIDPKVVVQAGNMATQALRDPAMYQMAMDMIVKNGIMTQQEIKSASKDRVIGITILAGKLAQMLVNEGM